MANEGGNANDPKSPPKGSVPPRAALARKLTAGHSIPPASRSAAPPPALGSRVTTGSRAAAAPPSSGPASPPSSQREKVYAARRRSVAPETREEDEQEAPRSSPPPAREKKLVRIAAALGGLAALGLLGVVGARAVYDRSDAGRVKNGLAGWELSARDPAARTAIFAELDGRAPASVVAAIELLLDPGAAESGGSHSSTTYQELANVYLLHYAEVVKAPAPPQAREVTEQIFLGKTPAAAQWSALRDAWRAWLADAQGRGAAPK